MDTIYGASQQPENFDDINVVETKDETDKKCPNCGGVMEYDPAAGKIKCPYCDYEEEIKITEDTPLKAEELDFDEADFTANCNWGVKTKTVICEACGAEAVYDDLQTAAVCPFCGSNQVMDANNVDTMAPGGVVPFAVTDKQASDYFKSWIKKKWFCPKLAKESAKPDKFQGVYLPYWTFDTNTKSNYTGEYGIDHTTKDKDGDTHTHTEWHRTAGTYQAFFDDELVFATDRHDPGILSDLEPFRTEDNKSYKPEYIAGFMAERYSLGIKDAWKRAKDSIREKIMDSVKSKIRRQYNADHVRNVRLNIDFANVTYKYLLLPVWMSSFKYKEKVYHFMVNGQTGKVGGKTPISIPKVVLTILGVLLVLGIIYALSN